MDPISLIPIHFEQLRELRNGSISYVQIIKRDQTRPPVRPVCRKLGVSKLSEIATEAELYNALVYVAQNQYAKMKDSNRFEDSDGNSSGFDTARSDVSDLMRTTPRQELYSPRDAISSLVGAPNSGSWDDHGKVDSLVAEPEGYSYGEGRDAQPTGFVPDFNVLLNCLLSIRQTWGPYKRLDLFSHDFNIPESVLSAALQYVCESCGCRHLDPNVPADRVANAASLFFRSRFPSAMSNAPKSGQDSFRRPNSSGLSASAPGFYPESPPTGQAGNPASLQFRPFVQQRDPMHNRAGHAHYQNQHAHHSPRGVYQGYPPNVPNFRPQASQQAAFQHHEDLSSAYNVQSGVYPGAYKTNVHSQPNVAAMNKPKLPAPAPAPTSGIGSVPALRYGSNIRPDGVAALSPPVAQNVPLSPALAVSGSASGAKSNNLLSAYQQFWENVYQLFVSLFDTNQNRTKSIELLANISGLVIAGQSTPALQLLACLDTVSCASCLELVSKLEANPASYSADSVKDCLDAFTRFVVVPCTKLESGFVSMQIESVVSELQKQFFYSIPVAISSDSLLKLSDRFKGAIDDIFFSHIQPLLSPGSWAEVCEHIRFRLEAMVQVFQRDSNVHLFGSAMLGLHCQQDIVDFTALLPLTETTEYKYLAKKRDLAKRIKVLEAALAMQLQTDSALTHFKSTIAIIRNSITQPSTTPTSSGVEGVSKARNNSKFSADMELICKFGERYANTLQGEVDLSRRQPQLRALLEQLHTLRIQHAQIINSLETTKLKEIEGLKSALSQFGYTDVAFAENIPGNGLTRNEKQVLAGYPMEERAIVFTDMDAPTGPMRCRIVVCRPLFVHSTRLLSSYFNLDSTGKVLSFIAIVKAFTAAHEINVELNTYSWNILALHYLLSKKYLCCIQDAFLVHSHPNIPRLMCGDIDVSFSDTATLTAENVSNLAKTSIFELLLGFFRYFVSEFNLFGGVVTLRENGEILPKSIWGPQSDARLWCLSIEDPLEHSGSPQPNDLGKSLTREGQRKIFDVLRQGYYSLVGLSKTHEEAELESHVYSFFSTSSLKQAALAAGYTEFQLPPVSPSAAVWEPAVAATITNDSADSSSLSSSRTSLEDATKTVVTDESVNSDPSLSKSPPPLPPPGFGSESEEQSTTSLVEKAASEFGASRKHPIVPRISLSSLGGGQDSSTARDSNRSSFGGYPGMPGLPHLNSNNSLLSSATSSPSHSNIFSEGSTTSSARSDLTGRSSSFHPMFRSGTDYSPPGVNTMKFFGDNSMYSSRSNGPGLPLPNTGSKPQSANNGFMFDWTSNAIFSDGDLLGGSLMSSVDDDGNDDFVAAANELKTGYANLGATSRESE